MGSLRNKINRCPRLTPYLVASYSFDRDPLCVVDVGARGGFEGHWSLYDNQIRLIGFEPDVEECERLNQEASTKEKRYFPIALHQSRGKWPFYVTAYPASSGFYRPDMKFWKRFPDERNLAVTGIVEIDTIDLDTFAVENCIGPIDFIKLDVEGAELEVLKGAKRTLEKSVFGLSVEVVFLPVHENQATFRDIDSFLQPLGFVLYDLTLNRKTRKALSPYLFSQIPRSSERGQLIWGQAVYLRDAACEIKSSCGLEDGWNDMNVLKLASFMELICLNDCAIELIQVAHQHGLLRDTDLDHFIDLLTPSIGRKRLSYRDYIESLKTPKPDDNLKKIKHRLQLSRKFIPRPVRHIIRGCLVKSRDLIEKVLNA